MNEITINNLKWTPECRGECRANYLNYRIIDYGFGDFTAIEIDYREHSIPSTKILSANSFEEIIDLVNGEWNKFTKEAKERFEISRESVKNADSICFKYPKGNVLDNMREMIEEYHFFLGSLKREKEFKGLKGSFTTTVDQKGEKIEISILTLPSGFLKGKHFDIGARFNQLISTLKAFRIHICVIFEITCEIYISDGSKSFENWKFYLRENFSGFGLRGK